MRGQIPPGVIHMHKGAINIGHAFKHILQALAQIVAVPQSHGGVEHDVDFDDEFVPRVIRLQALNLANRAGESHREV